MTKFENILARIDDTDSGLARANSDAMISFIVHNLVCDKATLPSFIYVGKREFPMTALRKLCALQYAEPHTPMDFVDDVIADKPALLNLQQFSSAQISMVDGMDDQHPVYLLLNDFDLNWCESGHMNKVIDTTLHNIENGKPQANVRFVVVSDHFLSDFEDRVALVGSRDIAFRDYLKYNYQIA